MGDFSNRYLDGDEAKKADDAIALIDPGSSCHRCTYRISVTRLQVVTEAGWLVIKMRPVVMTSIK